MKMRLFTAVMTSILLAGASAPALAKTKAECTKEWQSQKAAMQAAHKTEKDFVKECRGTATTGTSAAPAAKSGDGKERAY